VQKLEEHKWFNEKWASELRDAARALARHYASACEGVEALPKPFQRVALGGLRGGRRLWVVKLLFREAVNDHIRSVISRVGLLHWRAYSAARPDREELRRRVKDTAAAEAVEADKARLAEFDARQRKISELLEEASRDFREMLELLKSDERIGQNALKSILRLIRRVLPFAWAGSVIATFGRWSNAPQIQLLIFFAGVTAIYHVLAWFTLLFHDAAERKWALFQGYFGTPSDGLYPLEPVVSRLEESFFKILGSRPPIVISWETVVPVFHYITISVVMIIMLFKLPFSHTALGVALVLCALLIRKYAIELFWLWRLLKVRYPGRAWHEIVLALLPPFQVIEPFMPLDDDEGKGEADASADV
jgi:hypothetical protein